MSLWSAFFGFGQGKIRQALQDGAVIIDLRNATEYDQGHIRGSLNIPIDRIRANTGRIRDLRKPVILCCADGSHCYEALDMLRDAGIERVVVGGSWESVLKITKG